MFFLWRIQLASTSSDLNIRFEPRNVITHNNNIYSAVEPNTSLAGLNKLKELYFIHRCWLALRAH